MHYPVAAQSARSRLVHRQAHTLTLTQSVTRARSLSLSLLSCADSLSRQSLTNSVAVSVSTQSARIDSAQSVCAMCDSALCATARVLSLSLLSFTHALSSQSLRPSVVVSVCDSAQSASIHSAQSVCAVCNSAQSVSLSAVIHSLTLLSVSQTLRHCECVRQRAVSTLSLSRIHTQGYIVSLVSEHTEIV